MGITALVVACAPSQRRRLALSRNTRNHRASARMGSMATGQSRQGTLSFAAPHYAPWPRRQGERLMLRVVYPGTFDPFTRGHEDLVRRAANLFDDVVVGVADSRGKRPLFDLSERVEMAREVLAPLPNVRVEGFNCLLMDFVQQMHSKLI